MQSLLPHQMVLSTATICDLCDLFPEFSMLRQLARVAMCEAASPSLLIVCQLLSDCTYDKQRQRFPNYGHLLDYGESHGRSMLQEQSNKRSDCYPERKLHDVKVELHGDMEYEQIY
jgi:hypothetical protein